MGLEIVELIMWAEETFGIEIPDEDAERLPTAGALYEYTLKALDAKHGNRHSQGWSDTEVWESLKVLIAEVASVPPEQILPGSHLIHDLHLG